MPSSLASFLLSLAASLIVLQTASAATIVLQDGSVIRGDIRSLQNDVYTIRTDSMGTLAIRKQDVRSIDLTDESAPRNATRTEPRASSPAAPRTAPGIAPGPAMPSAAEFESMQRQLMGSPDMLSAIQALQNDPQVLSVLSDPEVMNAIATGDINTLMNHPKVIGLTRNPGVREIIEGVQ